MAKLIRWVIVAIFTLGTVGFGLNIAGTYINNKQNFAIQKVDDATRYETIKEVENTARAMISSYESDVLVYQQYKDSDNTEEKSWGEEAKMRANRTASTYNNYILKNSFVWEGNVPQDIKTELLTVQ